MKRSSRLAATLVSAVAVAAPLAACGDDEHEFAGYVRSPLPEVGDLSLPEVNNGGEEFALRADDGELLLVYFGFTNCPDFCPSTLSDVRLARNRLADDGVDVGRVELAMVTVDPDRDLDLLGGYVTSFVEGGHALGTDDPRRLEEVAAPFGAAYEVGVADDGDVEVAHTTALYAVDDAGELVMTWQFGVPVDDLTADLEALLEEAEAA
jgi:protein SCO1/2